MSLLPSWFWIAVVVFAALSQTVRNTAQRSLSGGNAGALGATLARFLYGIPLALVYVAALQMLSGDALRLPNFSWPYLFWLATGAAAQVAATALLLGAMHHGNFVVAVTYSKTEVLQVALLGTLLLHEVPTGLSIASMVVAVVGVALLMRAAMKPAPAGQAASRFFGPAALFGLGSGACFAYAAVGYRLAGLEMTAAGGISPWHVSGWSVLLAQVMQSACIMAWLVLREPAALRAVFSGWRVSLTAGMAGAMASFAWFLAYVLRPAADVRALGMIEVVSSYLVSRSLMRERILPLEKIGLVLVLLGGIGACLGAR